MKPEVQPGEVRLASVSVLYDTPEMYVLEIDCRTKYPEARPAAGRSLMKQTKTADNPTVAIAGPEVILFAGEYTLRPDETLTGPTVIRLPPKCEGWQVVVDTHGRYTIRIAAFPWPLKEPVDVWWPEETP